MMISVEHFFGLMSAVFVVGAALGCAYLLVAAFAVLNFPRFGPPLRGPVPPVTILKPLCGSELGLASRLARFCKQDYDGSIQMICGVQDRGDPAIEAVRETVDGGGLPGAVELQVDTHCRAANRKVANLSSIVRKARHDLLVVTDSDIEVDSHYLSLVVAQQQQPDVGAVTCLYHGVAKKGHWSQQAALGINIHYLPGIAVALHFNLAKPCFGSTIALRKATLERIGGFEAFADSLADDYAIGEAVRSLGYAVSTPPMSVGHACCENSLGAVFAQELRTARTIKSLRPLGYCGTIIAHPLPLALMAVLFGPFSAGTPLLLVAAALSCRTLLCHCVAYRFQLGRQPFWLIPIRDLLSFAVYLASFFGTRVLWRGFNYDIGAGSKVVPEPNSLASFNERSP